MRLQAPFDRGRSSAAGKVSLLLAVMTSRAAPNLEPETSADGTGEIQAAPESPQPTAQSSQRSKAAARQNIPPTLAKRRTNAPTPLLRTFYLVKAELLKLGEVNLLNNTFKAQIWVHFVCKGGALDPDFAKSGVCFPMDEDGRPTFRPSASWYQEQLEFANAQTCKRLDCNVQLEGEDVHLKSRWEGTFHEDMELQDFPADTQALKMALSMNCRTSGMIPAAFSLDGATSGVELEGFTQGMS